MKKQYLSDAERQYLKDHMMSRWLIAKDKMAFAILKKLEGVDKRVAVENWPGG